MCNAHLDPVWLWEWEEGAAEAVSTFRVAADFCDEFSGFVFNHNEVILYEWVREYEPSLFKRIQRLAREGKWHIMGGWYLQPDCNMPSGESFVRQILLGRRYFKAHFGAVPSTAINFDPFGHTRGLVQILRKSGYDSYIFCRPGDDFCRLSSDRFTWEGYDGSRITCARVPGSYLSHRGQARRKAESVMTGSEACKLVLWGVGNHGGGPSREDLVALKALMTERPEAGIRHSTPEEYFKDLRRVEKKLPVHKSDLNPWAVGCYTSQVRIKQKHRLLENELFACEKMSSAAWLLAGCTYPAEALRRAGTDLAMCEFHDILPGSSIQPVEEMAIRVLDHALEEISRIKARAFFALSAGQKSAAAGTIPILVYNPHPFMVRTMVECEFQLPDQNWDTTFTSISVRRDGKSIPAQIEQELSNIPLDWRKRVAFQADLAPSAMNRFDCFAEVVKQRPAPVARPRGNRVLFKSGDAAFLVNFRTGLIDSFVAGGVEMLGRNAFLPVVMDDTPESWAAKKRFFSKQAGRFKLLGPAAAAALAGLKDGPLAPVRMIEDGPVRSVVEALFGYNNSFLVQRYKLPKQGTEFEVETRVFWNEKDKMLKLSIPTRDAESDYYGQVAYGMDRLPENGDEAVAQKWVAVVSEEHNTALTCINNGIYGSDFKNGRLRLSLLRSPAYSALPLKDRRLMPPGRFSPRIDQGERCFSIWINGGRRAPRMSHVDREALSKNERPMALSFFPPGAGRQLKPFVVLDDDCVQISALKKAEDSDSLVLRLFEPTGRKRRTKVHLPFANMVKSVDLNKFEIKTFKINCRGKTWIETDLMEQPLRRSSPQS